MRQSLGIHRSFPSAYHAQVAEHISSRRFSRALRSFNIFELTQRALHYEL